MNKTIIPGDTRTRHSSSCLEDANLVQNSVLVTDEIGEELSSFVKINGFASTSEGIEFLLKEHKSQVEKDSNAPSRPGDTKLGGGSVSGRKPRVIVGITGSVATIKLPPLLIELLKFAEVQVISTQAALHFLDWGQINLNMVPVRTDDEEYKLWKKRGDPVLHIELRKWADVLLIAPLSANSLAKMANGLCDNLLVSVKLLSCVMRAWEFDKKKVILAPAMNTNMWNSKFTKQHLNVLTSDPFNCVIVPPISKKLMCGDVGNGAMADILTIAGTVRELTTKK